MNLFKREPKHEHSWVATGVDNMQTTVFNVEQNKDLIKRQYTVVHRICIDCKDLEAKEVNGSWKLEEIRDVDMRQLNK